MAGISTGTAPVPTTTASTYLSCTVWNDESSPTFRQAVMPTSGTGPDALMTEAI